MIKLLMGYTIYYYITCEPTTLLVAFSSADSTHKLFRLERIRWDVDQINYHVHSNDGSEFNFRLEVHERDTREILFLKKFKCSLGFVYYRLVGILEIYVPSEHQTRKERFEGTE